MDSGSSCPKCATANPADASFCMSCGTSLARSCPSCGAEVPGAARFCMGCGAELTDGAGAGREPAEAAPSEERRTVTVMFADLSGYTSVAERLDHETVKALTERCLN